jgi:hypothetical protein
MVYYAMIPDPKKISKATFAITGTFLLLICVALAGSETIATNHTISLTVRNQPMVDVLAKISDMTGFSLSISPEWEQMPITVSFDNESLHNGLKRILSKLNYAIIYGSGKHIALVIFDGATKGMSYGSQSSVRAFAKLKNLTAESNPDLNPLTTEPEDTEGIATGEPESNASAQTLSENNSQLGTDDALPAGAEGSTSGDDTGIDETAAQEQEFQEESTSSISNNQNLGVDDAPSQPADTPPE